MLEKLLRYPDAVRHLMQENPCLLHFGICKVRSEWALYAAFGYSHVHYTRGYKGQEQSL